MVKKQKRKGDSGGWIMSYADMVSLLMCFFVLMYAISSPDAAKFQILVMALNPSAAEVTQVVNVDVETEGEDPLDHGGDYLATDEVTFDQLYWALMQFVEDNDMTEDVQVAGGDGFTFIVFRNNILFEGDRFNLTPASREVLDFLGEAMGNVSHLIGEIRVLGHTNQADPQRPNPVRGDRFLASNRATEVVVYLQEKNIVEPRMIIPVGLGQFFPVAPFELEEDRLKNRRVEILITEVDAMEISLEYLYAQVYGLDFNI